MYTVAGQQQPSADGHFFASSVLSALGSKGNENLTGAMESMLGLGKAELEEMRGELAWVYDKWKMERVMRTVTLGDADVPNFERVCPIVVTPEISSANRLA